MSEKGSRYSGIITQDQMDNQHIFIVGVGAIGRQVAIQASAMGFNRLTLCDFDKIEIHNCGTQGFAESEIGTDKVTSVARYCGYVNPSAEISKIHKKFSRKMLTIGMTHVIMCVDMMEVRKEIYEAVQGTCNVIDGRMTAQALTVITEPHYVRKKKYMDHWFTDAEAIEGACTTRSTLYCANVAAGIMLSLITRTTLEQEVPTRIDCGLVDYSMSTEK